MRITFLILTNAVLVLAANHRLRVDNQELSSHRKKDLKFKTEKNTNITLHGSKENKITNDERSKERKEEYENPWNLSKESDRIQFQMEGHEGPQTYIFGFDTGHGKSRQYRLEERLQDGTVKGQYGYYDARGKLRTVRYVARPFEGYTEKHHEITHRN
ncbi:uncharacterized protein LOC122398683 [Colletes gigas]|uniref:uncharacterized protein LOC122398683 n=1 Tax=Colletes gigas TaxID=935657 RepID=UPI001C9AABB3|nr:uncharacterized protein LOC122398683 [Colletes gigas]